MSDTWWYEAPDGKAVGPMGWDELRALAAVGRIRPVTLVRDGSGPWRESADVPGLRPVKPTPAAAAGRWKAWGGTAGLLLTAIAGIARQGGGVPAPVSKPRRPPDNVSGGTAPVMTSSPNLNGANPTEPPHQPPVSQGGGQRSP